MIPGSVSRVVEGVPVTAANTITLRGGEVFRVTGTTQIETINPPLGTGQNQVVFLIPTTGVTIIGAAGNVAAGVTMALNRSVMLTFLRSTGKWYVENGA